VVAWIILRQFAWTERPAPVDPYPEVDTIHPVAPDRLLPIDLSHAVGVNALAVPASGPVRYETRQHELRLMLCYLDNTSDHPIRLRDQPFRASASHIRRFVSESIGLGMLTAAIRAAYELADAETDLTALPTMLAGHVTATKARPDILFTMPGGATILAGEGRGRSEPAPTRVTVQERDRLNSLLPWSHHHGTHPLAMSWAYATGSGVTVDLFTRSGRLPRMQSPIGQAPSPVAVQPELFSEDELGTPGRPRPQPSRGTKARDFDRTSPRALTTAITRRTNDIHDQLYATAPESPVKVGGQALRGGWAALDLLGPATGSFLLGILENPLPEDTTPTAAHVSGRLLVVLTDEPGHPWHLIAD
jgi:hypothetical protein